MQEHVPWAHLLAKGGFQGSFQQVCQSLYGYVISSWKQEKGPEIFIEKKFGKSSYTAKQIVSLFTETNINETIRH